MYNPNYVRKSRNTARILIAPVFAAAASQSLPGASKSKIGAVGAGDWVLDQNGNNTWDGPPIDGVPLWSTGDPREIAVYGDWNGDGRTKMGVYLDGVWILDYNGNGVWDGPDVDKVFTFGSSDFVPIVGDWNHTGWTKIGIHGISNSAAGQFLGQFLLDYNGNFRWDDTTVDRAVYWSLGITTGEIAVIGDWNGDGNDKIGIYSGGYWVLDYNGNNAWDGLSVDRDVYWSIDSHDIPVVGNWNGQLNSTKIGVYSDGHWMADYNGNFILDGQTRFSFFGGGNSTFLPAVGDWNDDGKTKIAAYLITSGTWWIEKSGNWLWDGPSGGDVYTSFGGPTYTKPIVGAWERPPTFIISGQVGDGIAGVPNMVVNLSGSQTGTATTDSSGNYSFTVVFGGSYTANPVLSGYTFLPSIQSFTNLASNVTANFVIATGTVPGVPGSEPPSDPTPVTTPPADVTGSMADCNDISGTWNSTDGLFSLSQSGSTVSGTQTQPDVLCGTVTWQINGPSRGDGLFTLTASNPSPPVDACGVTVGSGAANVQITSCSSATLSGSTVGSNGSQSATRNGFAAASTTTWTRTSAPLGIQVTANLSTNNVSVVLSGQNKVGNLSVVISGASTRTLGQVNQAAPGTYPFGLQRTNLTPGQYGTITATWDNSSLPLSMAFKVIGGTRYTVYNTPVEGTCSSPSLTPVAIFENDPRACLFTMSTVKAMFVAGVQLNGSGNSTDFGLVLPWANTWLAKFCPVPPLPGLTDNNTFVRISNIFGTCGSRLSGDVSLATSPDPNVGTSSWACSDNVLLVNPTTGQNISTRVVQDWCPACVGDFRGQLAHIDAYSSSIECDPSKVVGSGNFFTIRLR